ncbi:ABC transporter ATP-binding protein [Flavobacterium sp.]|uniref:ABC transporter ATP-binding protein n=1 Tax=Flavobacterium sp. TaxID=239 RepID=UPI003753DE85
MNNKLIEIIKANFKYLFFFYRYLKTKILWIIIFSFFVSLLDAISLSMFIPLFDVASNSSQTKIAGEGFNFQSLFGYIGMEVTVNNILLLMLVFFFVKGVFRYLDVYFRVLLTSFFIKKIRFNLLYLIANLKYSKFVKTDLGTIQNILTQEVSNVISAYSQYFSVFQNIIFVVVYMTLSLIANAKFTLIVIFGGIFSNLILKKFYINSESLSYSITSKNNNFSSLVMQQVTNFKYLKATATMPIYIDKLTTKINEIEEDQKKLGLISGLILSIREPVIIFFLISAIFIQVNWLKGQLSTILLSLLFFYRAFNSFMNVQLSWNGFLKYVGSIKNLEEFQVSLTNENENINGLNFEKINNTIDLKNISFHYSEKSPIITNLSYSIKKNTTTAIVGKSGSGKTTLVNIIAGLLEPVNGEIMIDDNELNQYNRNSYRNRIGFISQETVVFNDTLFNNITFWAEKTQENNKRFLEVIQKVDLSVFLNNSELKEDTVLGDNGVMMSGGQRQRLSIARELYKQNEILILDEATSSLDSETEKLIQESIDNIKGSVTILIIAHRLSTIKNADTILVLKNGVIESSGSFTELMEKSKSFEKMVNLQEL